MSRLPSSLARYAAAMRDPTGPDALAGMRQRAWLDHGIAVLRLCDLADDWERATVNAIATRLYGRRTG